MLGKCRGEFDRAESAYRRALAIVRDRRARATLLHNLAGLAHARGEAGAAVSLARAGLALRGRSPGRTADLAALAAILVDLGEYTEAEALLAEVLAEVRDPYEIAVARHNLGSLRYRMGDLTGAAGDLAAALAAKRRVLGRRHPDLAITLHNLALVRADLGDPASARRLYRRAVGLLDGVVSADHPTLVACREFVSASRTRSGHGPDGTRVPRPSRPRP